MGDKVKVGSCYVIGKECVTKRSEPFCHRGVMLCFDHPVDLGGVESPTCPLQR